MTGRHRDSDPARRLYPRGCGRERSAERGGDRLTAQHRRLLGPGERGAALHRGGWRAAGPPLPGVNRRAPLLSPARWRALGAGVLSLPPGSEAGSAQRASHRCDLGTGRSWEHRVRSMDRDLPLWRRGETEARRMLGGRRTSAVRRKPRSTHSIPAKEAALRRGAV